MAIHSSILAWRIPWTEEPGGLQSTGWQVVGHDWSDIAAAGTEEVKCEVRCKSLSQVWLFATPWTIQSMNFLGQNAGVDSRSLLQGIFPAQGSNADLPKCRWILYQLNHQGSPETSGSKHRGPFLLTFSVFWNFNPSWDIWMGPTVDKIDTIDHWKV